MELPKHIGPCFRSSSWARWAVEELQREKHRQKFGTSPGGLLKRSVGQNYLSMHADRGLHPLLHVFITCCHRREQPVATNLPTFLPTFLPSLWLGSWKLVLHFRGSLLTFTLAALPEIKACVFAQAECRLCCQNEVNIWLRCSSALMLPSRISPAQLHYWMKKNLKNHNRLRVSCVPRLWGSVVCASMITPCVQISFFLPLHFVLSCTSILGALLYEQTWGFAASVAPDSPCEVSRLIDLLSTAFCNDFWCCYLKVKGKTKWNLTIWFAHIHISFAHLWKKKQKKTNQIKCLVLVCICNTKLMLTSN